MEQSAPSPTTPNVVLNFYGDPSKGVQGKRSGPPQMGKRFNSNSNAANRPALPCIFCDSPQHRSHACDKYTTWLTRKKRLQTKPKPVCIRCLRAGHSKPAQCLKEKATLCYMKSCKRKSTQERNHHPLLCRKTYPDSSDKKTDKTVHVVGREDDTKAESSDDASSACYSDVDEEYDYGSRPPTDMEDSDEECYTNVAHKVETVLAVGTSNRTLMQLAVAEVSNVIDEAKKKPCRIFFDSGSSDTLITKDQARELDLPILRRSTTTFHHFGGSPEGRTEETWRVQFRVFFSDGSQEVLEADAVDSLCSPLPSLPLRRLEVEQALRQPRMAVPCEMEQPQILVGLDQMHLFQLKPRSKRLPNGFSVYDSRLGPILCGRGNVIPQTKANRSQTINCVFRSETVPTTVQVPARTNAVSQIVTKSQELQAIERLASLEGIGIESPGKVNEEELVLQRHKETLTRLPDGRYEVSFPFRDEILTLQRAGVPPRVIYPPTTNPRWPLALDIIEKVDTKLFMEKLKHLVHYLAHHPVFRADKPTQLRIVFDGSARSGPGTRSLNDCLHPGPSLLESLIGILLRSRGAQILIIGDIEKAFLQISLREEDRDVTRFLWLKDPAKPPTPDNLVTYRYKRIPFGLNASPFLLLATIEYHLKRNTYSDNVFLLAHTPEDGVQKYKETKLIFNDMKMNIREFISNSPQFNEAIPEEDRAKQTKEATLGHEWDSKQDVWTFRLPEPNPFKRDLEASSPTASNSELVDPTAEEGHVMVSRKVKSAKVMTKRVMLSILHGLWDPLNFLCPLTLQARIVHQELWAQEPKLKWD
ncbi:Pao retrotransposon peptidase family protein, partial [Aphelenchoides avenae]